MNKLLLNTDIQIFINKNINKNLLKLALQKNPFSQIEWTEILNQIACKSKAKYKLPTFYKTANILYPSKISLEQTSSEKTALYKSKIIDGKNIIDLSGGFGVDAVFFSKKFKNVTHCEIQSELSQIANHNFQALQISNIETICGDGLEYLTKNKTQYDWIYIDPSRRTDTKRKVFLLKDCIPNVPLLLTNYFEFTDQILIKTSPIFDISSGISELQFVKSVHIVAVDNEVKELLWSVENNYKGEITVHAVNILNEKTDILTFVYYKKSNQISFDFPSKYLYEPNASIMKSGGFDEIADQFEVSKLHQNSHLYTSNKLIDFPGRTFEIVNQFEYTKSNMNQFLKNMKANITTRNFNESVEGIRLKWKIKDGGDHYCFFTTNIDNKKIVIIGSYFQTNKIETFDK